MSSVADRRRAGVGRQRAGRRRLGVGRHGAVRPRLAFIASIATFALTAALVLLAAPGRAAVDQTTAARIAAIGVPFAANRGQTDPEVAFVARTFAGSVFVTRDGRIVYGMTARDNGKGDAHKRWAIAESFGNRRLSSPQGLRASAAVVSDLVGADEPRADQPAFDRVTLGQVADGITLEVAATGNNVEKLFHVQPGADVDALTIRIDGATRLSIDDDGALAVGTGIGDLTFTAPIAYQEVDGKRTAVGARYRLGARPGEYGFTLDAYDRTRPLVIDPLIRSTYAGGGAGDAIRGMLVHPGSGQVYVVGSTASSVFPIVPGPGPTNAGGTDAFVARYTSGLTTLQKVVLYGGTGDDSANAIAILPSSGHIYIAGRTTSASGLAGVAGQYNGGGDAFIVHFDGALTVIAGAYFGGTLDDGATALAADNFAGEIVMAGDTRSLVIPVGGIAGAQTTPGGGQDAFVARFSASLGLISSTFLGGLGDDQALAVAIDPLRADVVVAGSTLSTNFPGVADGGLPFPGGGRDGFVTRFSSTLSTRQQSSYFGGSGNDQIAAVAIHPVSSHVYVTGDTTSADLRGRLVGQKTKDVGVDAFVACFYPELTGVRAVSYFGGAGDDAATAIAISPTTGEVYIAGHTTSNTLPAAGFGVQPSNSGGIDAFVARFDVELAAVRQATLLGGGGVDKAYAIALSEPILFVAGEAGLLGGPPIFKGVGGNSAQETPGGGASDGFIGSMTSDLRELNSNPPAFSFAPVPNALPLSVQTSAPAKVTPAPGTNAAVVYVDGQPGSTWCASTSPSCTCELTGNSFIPGSMTLVATFPYYVCVRQIAAAASNVVTEATLHIGTTAATFRVGTGPIPGLGCGLDIDGNGTLDGLTDGLLFIRALFGLTGQAATTNAIGAGATRQSWSDISAYLNANCGTNFAP